MIRHFSATVYVGTIPGSRLPRSFEDDVLRSRSPVIWLNANVKQLYDRDPRQFERRYGWTPGALDTRTYPWVLYKGRTIHPGTSSISLGSERADISIVDAQGSWQPRLTGGGAVCRGP